MILEIRSTSHNLTTAREGFPSRAENAQASGPRHIYDNLGQLIREDNRPLNKSYTWTYDNAGNRLTQKTYAFTTGTLGAATSTKNYGYASDTWGDRLTSYNGTAITYDAIGNPTNIGGEYGIHLEWQGRQLMSHWDADADWYVNFTYNDEGVRTSKLVGDYELHEYILSGSQIVAEKITTGSMEHLLVYIYDESGSPIGLKYRNNTYSSTAYDCFFFEKNLQGDVIAVYNSTGEKIGTYTYDAWGNFTTAVISGSTSLEQSIVGRYNPFRYRGYYYDIDLGWYYLQSRYYNPQWGRFINADAMIGTGGFAGYSLFVYCANNPIMFVDPCGTCVHHQGRDANVCSLCAKDRQIAGLAGLDYNPPPLAEYGPSGETILNKGEYEAYIEKLYLDMIADDYEGNVLNGNLDHYYGARVVIMDNDILNSFQFGGTIYLKKSQLKEIYLRHEYGHYVQEQNLGTTKYLFGIALPSISVNCRNMFFKDISNSEYYSMPWEVTADLFGGVSRSYSYQSGAETRGLLYYMVLKGR